MKTNPTKTKLITFISLILSGIVAFAAPAPIDVSHYTAPIRVACVGDSITAGAGAEGKPYPKQLQALLGDKWLVNNYGVGGRTLLKKGDHPYWIEKNFTFAHDFKPDVVIIMLGTNDTKAQNWVHEDELSADYKDLIESFKNLDSKPRIFICRPCPVVGAGKYGINEANLDIEIPVIDKVAADEGVDEIDMHAALPGNTATQPDTVHPNAAGSALMAQAAANVLTGKTTP